MNWCQLRWPGERNEEQARGRSKCTCNLSETHWVLLDQWSSWSLTPMPMPDALHSSWSRTWGCLAKFWSWGLVAVLQLAENSNCFHHHFVINTCRLDKLSPARFPHFHVWTGIVRENDTRRGWGYTRRGRYEDIIFSESNLSWNIQFLI